MLRCLFRPICRRHQCFEFHTLHRNIVPNVFFNSARSPPVVKKSTSEKDSIGSSTIVVQDGLNIQELPLVIKKTKVFDSNIEGKGTNTSSALAVFSGENEDFKENLDKCQTLNEIFELLEIVPSESVTPIVAAYALKCIADLHSHVEFRNEGKLASEKYNTNTFTRTVVLNKLYDIVCESNDVCVVIDGLRAVVRTNLILGANNALVDKFINEILLRISDGKASLAKICEFASLIVAVGERSFVLDQLWCSISEKWQEIDSKNLVKLYRLLPSMKHSRGVVFRLLEKRTYVCWWQLTIADVDEILNVLCRINFRPQKLLFALTKWIHLHIHTLSENELSRLIMHFKELDHIDQDLKSSIERYVKAKKMNMMDPALITKIMSFSLHFRLQSNVILDSIAQYFTAHSGELSALNVVNIVTPYGLLNYAPSNCSEFYKKLEEVMENNFVQFRPEDLVELLLSCTYIQRYPLNFVKKVFNPHFLQRLNTIQDKVQLQKAYTNLRLLDMAMTLECRRYHGPLLPREMTSTTLVRDGRIFKIINRMGDVLVDLLGGLQFFSSNKWLRRYPLSEMYILDFIVHFDNDGNIMPVQNRAKIGKRKGIIIHMPEHYCHNSKSLIGQQTAKIRILRRMGYDVISMDYEELCSLYVKPQDLSLYIKRNIFND